MVWKKGKNLRVVLADKKVWHATESSFTTSRDVEEIATKDTDAKEQTLGDISWSLSVSNMVADLPVGNTTHVDTDSLLQSYLDGDLIAVQFIVDDAAEGEKYISGNVYLTQCDITASNGATVTGSFTLTGTGAFTIETVPAE